MWRLPGTLGMLGACAHACLGIPTSAGPKDAQRGHPGPGQDLFTCPKVGRGLPGRASAGESPQLCAQDADNVCPGEGWAAPGWDKSGPQAALPGRAPAGSATVGRAWGTSISPAGFGAPRPLSSASLSLSACFVPPTASWTLLGAFLLGPQLLHL